MSNLLTGNTMGQAYRGTAANQPPNCAFEHRAPTQYDIQFSLMDLWLDQSTMPDGDVWILTSLAGNSTSGGQLAHWVKLTSNTGGAVLTLTGNSGGAVPPDGSGNIDILGDNAVGLTVVGNPGTNTLTITSNGAHPFGQSLTADSGGTVFFDASGNINVIANSAAQNSGSSVTIAGNPGTHTLTLDVTDSNNNTLVGNLAGNATLTGTNNTALGKNALHGLTSGAQNIAVGSGAVLGALTSGSDNVSVGYGSLTDATTGASNIAIGSASLNSLTTGAQNVAVGQQTLGAVTTSDASTAVGYQSLIVSAGASNTAVGSLSLDSLTTGTNNIAIGSAAGSAYTTSESSNILIGNAGVISESNVIRIGTTGGGAGQQNTAFMAGTYGVTPSGGAFLPVIIDNAGQLGTGPALPFSSINIVVITSSGTYTPTAGMKYCIVEIVGGGGGGGATAASGGANAGAAGGASGGGYARGAFSAATIGGSQAVTIGAGGPGGAIGANDGTDGGTTTFGALMTATGGNGGFHADQDVVPLTALGGNVPGSGSGGQFNSSGQVGTNGFSFIQAGTFVAFPGKGGQSILGGSGGASAGAAMGGGQGAGGDAGGFGGGGGGGWSSGTGTGARGGNGTPGVCIVTEFI